MKYGVIGGNRRFAPVALETIGGKGRLLALATPRKLAFISAVRRGFIE